MIREGFSEEVTFHAGLKGKKGLVMEIWGENVLGRRNDVCKGMKVRTSVDM